VDKNFVTLLATAIIIALSIAIAFASAAVEDSEDSYTSAPPLIYIREQEDSGVPIDYAQHTNHPMIYSDTRNVTLWIKIRMPYQVYNAKLQGDVMWLGGHLTSISYKASWQNNKTINLYSGDSKTEYNFSLPNIPYGDHYLEIDASCVVNILDNYNGASHPFYDTAEKSLDFTVAPVPTPAPAPTPTPAPIAFNLKMEQIVALSAVIIAVPVTIIAVALLLYRRHRNHARLSVR
jgi:hypothetical protein